MIERTRNKLSLRQRIHYWLCDALNIVSADEFNGLIESLDQYFFAQNRFNRLVGERMKLAIKEEHDEEKRKNNLDKGMII